MGTCHIITMSPTWTHGKFHVWISSTQNLLTSTQSLTHFCYCCGQKRRWCLITVIGLFAFAVVWTHLWSTVRLDRTGHISFLTGQNWTPKFTGQVLPDQIESGLLFLKHLTWQAVDISYHKISSLYTNLV